MGLKLFSDEDPLEAIKRAILQHEDTFRSQVHELHRLYWTQKNLMSSVSRNDRSKCGDLFGWGSPPVAEKSHFGNGSVLPLEHALSSTCPSYQDRQRRIDFQMPVDDYGCHQINKCLRETGLACDLAASIPMVDLTLGFGDGDNIGKSDVTNNREGYLNQREVIDLDDSTEVVANEKGIVITSFGPKTPSIFSESRRECKQPRSCVVDASDKTRKYLDCGQSAYPLSAGQSATSRDNPDNQFTTKQHFSQTAELFDLNTVLPEEVDDVDIPICEAEEISSVVGGSSVAHYKSANNSCSNMRDVQSESGICDFWKTLAIATADRSNSTSTNSTLISDTKFIPALVNNHGTFVAGSQQSSNGSSPSLLPDLEKPVCGVGANHSSVDWGVVGTKPSVDMELNSGMPSFDGDLPVADNADVLRLKSWGTKDASDSKKPIIEEDETYGCNETYDGCESMLRWPDEVDRAVLMASTSLVHMSLENPIHSEKTKEEKCSEQPQRSIDSLEQIVLALSEYQEAECSSPFKPSEELGMSSKSRYSSRSGRKLRDFQKDVLPSIVALSRHEICEDMHAFTEIVGWNELKKKGTTRNSCRSVGRGRQTRRR